MTSFKISLLLLLSVGLGFSRDRDDNSQQLLQQQLDSLRQSIEVLKRIKTEKLNKLEQLETTRWQERYRQNQSTQEYQESVRSLESKYSRKAGDISRVNDEWVQTKTTTQEFENKLEDAKNVQEGLLVQIAQSIDKSATSLSSDFPVGIEERTLHLAQASELLKNANPSIEKALQLFFEDLEMRYQLTIDQEFSHRNSVFGSESAMPVYRLRTGTITLSEMERQNSNRVQSLLRTGALQGKVYEWRNDLTPELESNIQKSISAAQKATPQIWLPLDVLQNKSIKTTTKDVEAQNWKARAMVWFKTGGAVMYPLFLVAILALLLALERWILYLRRGRISSGFINKINKLVEQSRWTEARDLCYRQKTSIGHVLYAILNHSDGDREFAEKSLREAILREIPSLEKRLALISALGSSAPLLGLLGTVSGMITLFKVITEVGTNDARILAGGISEALITTQTGLVIAIPILLLHGYLAERLDNITASLSIQSMALLNKIWPDSSSKGEE